MRKRVKKAIPDLSDLKVKPQWWLDMHKPIKATIEGTFTPGEGLLELRDMLFRDYHSSETLVYISRQTHLELLYLAQGKRYPRLKKRKNKARMSKKWRNRA